MNEVELKSNSAGNGKELSVVERAQVALNSAHTEAMLIELARKYTDIALIVRREDYQIVMGALGEFRRYRNVIERSGKEAREDATRFGKAIIAEERRLVGIIEPEENRLKEVRKVWDDEQERIRQEAEEKEEARKDEIRQKVFGIAAMVQYVAGKSSSEVAELINRLDKITITNDEFAEFTRQAEGALLAAKEQAKNMLTEAISREVAEAEAEACKKAEAEARKKEREEFKVLQAEMKRQQDKMEAAIAKQQAEIRRQQEEAEAAIAKQRAELKRQQDELEAAIAKQQQDELETTIAKQQQDELETTIAKQQQDELETTITKQQQDELKRQQDEAKVKQPTLIDDLQGWKVKYKIKLNAFESLTEILETHGIEAHQTSALDDGSFYDLCIEAEKEDRFPR